MPKGSTVVGSSLPQHRKSMPGPQGSSPFLKIYLFPSSIDHYIKIYLLLFVG
uniref:Uncharacterized protein n=1 Tax=Rhizophora mucronata TaxID=61149 RepID=A0A2P2J1Y5_RHIMU